MLLVKARILIAVGIALYFIVVVYLIKKQRLELRYSLIWGILGIIFLFLDIFPNTIKWIAGILGFADPVNALFLICIFLLLVCLISFTGVISRQSRKIHILIQNQSILEKRLRDLEEQD